MTKKILVTAIFFLVSLPFAHGASAASLFLAPDSTGYSYLVGHTFMVSVYVTSQDRAMNAAQATLSFPADKLSVVSISQSSSIVNLWVQNPSYSNHDGTIAFGGVVTNPGFQGASGKIIGVTFQVKNSGTAPIVFDSGSVLANDGKGTNILSSMQGATIALASVQAPFSGGNPSGTLAIAATPAVSGGQWYSFNTIKFSWTLPADVDAVSYGLSNDPGYSLPKTPQPFVSSVSYDTTQFADGAWYFYASYESGGVWSPPSRRSFLLDRTPPDPFVIIQKNTALGAADPSPVFQWAATDKTSGIAHYQARIGDGDWFDPATIAKNSTYVLPMQLSTLSRVLTVRAYDRAGNFRTASIAFQVVAFCGATDVWCAAKAFIGEWLWLLVAMGIILVLMAYWFFYQIFSWRRTLRKELVGFREGLRRDLKYMEKNVDMSPSTGEELDLRPAHLQEKKALLEKTMERLEAEVKEEIKKFDKA